MNNVLFDQHIAVNVYEDPENGEHHYFTGQRAAIVRTRDFNPSKKFFITVITAPKNDNTDYTDRLHYRN
jgi:hypothetical protein